MAIEFVDYSGGYPCLCSGTLTIRIRGKEIELYNVLQSGGSVSWDDEDDYIEEGPWTLDRPEHKKDMTWYKSHSSSPSYHFSDEELNEIEALANDNVPWGCCGGCI